MDTSTFGSVLSELLARRELVDESMRAVMQALMSGQLGEAEAAAFLIALRMKGETANELAAAAQVLREHMIRWDPRQSDVLDTCGTGGDGSGTFNISTATAFVVAGAGVPVVKHGNRAVSSRSGSADVLALLGVKIDGDAEHARRCLHEAGLAFCLAPQFHPAVKRLADLRRRLRVGTLFNWLGPLVNPAGARCQLLGVGRRELLDLMAGALARLGTGHSLIVCSRDGLDEISLAAPTEVREVRGHSIAAWEWHARDFDLEPCELEDLKADGVEASAARIEQVLRGDEGSASRVILANAAAALLTVGRATSLPEGVALGRQSISSGRAWQVLEKLRTMK